MSECKDCRDTGTLKYKNRNENHGQEFVVFCGACENWKPLFETGANLLMARKDSILAMGFEMIEEVQNGR